MLVAVSERREQEVVRRSARTGRRRQSQLRLVLRPRPGWACVLLGTSLYGALGDGTYEEEGARDVRDPRAVRTSGHFTDVEVGSTNACGLTPSGSVICWGNNAHGEVGLGHTNHVRGPRAVTVLRGLG